MTNTVKIEGAIWAQYSKWSKDFIYSFYQGGMESDYLESEGFVAVALYEIEIEIPAGIDLHAGALKSLQTKRKLVLSANETKLRDVDAEIQEFMAIENKAEIA